MHLEYQMLSQVSISWPRYCQHVLWLFHSKGLPLQTFLNFERYNVTALHVWLQSVEPLLQKHGFYWQVLWLSASCINLISSFCFCWWEQRELKILETWKVKLALAYFSLCRRLFMWLKNHNSSFLAEHITTFSIIWQTHAVILFHLRKCFGGKEMLDKSPLNIHDAALILKLGKNLIPPSLMSSV